MLSQETAVQTYQILFWSSIYRLVFYARKPLESDAAVELHAVAHTSVLLGDQRTQGRTANASRFLETRKP